MDWGDLVAVQMLAEERSFSRAAVRLGVSQPALSQRISRLERRLGAPLVERGSGGVRLTGAGQRVCDATEEIATVWTGTLRSLGRLPSESPADLSPLVLAMTPGPVATVLRRCAETLPGVTVEPMLTEAPRAVEAVSTGIAQAAYVYLTPGSPLHLPPVLRVETILVEPIWLMVGTGHRLAGREQVHAAELSAERWVVWSTGWQGAALTELGRRNGFVPQVAHVVNQDQALRDLVSDGEFVCLSRAASEPFPDTTLIPLIFPLLRESLLISGPGLDAAVRRRLADALRRHVVLDWIASAAHFAAYLRLHPVAYAPHLDILDSPDSYDPSPSIGPSRPDLTVLVPAPDAAEEQCLLAVDSHRSLSRAARELHTSQPTLSARLRRLEQRLGAQLVARHSRGVTPTSSGKLLVSAVRRIRAIRTRVRQTLPRSATSMAHRHAPARLRLASYALGVTELAQRVGEALPGLVPQTVTAVPERGWDLLALGEVDFLVGYGAVGDPLPTAPRVDVRRLLHEPLWVALHAAHPLAALDEVPLAALSGEPWVLPPPGTVLRRISDSTLAEAGVKPKTVHVSDSAPTIRDLVGQEFGVTLATPLAAAWRDDDIVVRPLKGAASRLLWAAGRGELPAEVAKTILGVTCHHYATVARRVPGYLGRLVAARAFHGGYWPGW